MCQWTMDVSMDNGCVYGTLWTDGNIDVKPYIIAMSDNYESIKHDILKKAVVFYTI